MRRERRCLQALRWRGNSCSALELANSRHLSKVTAVAAHRSCTSLASPNWSLTASSSARAALQRPTSLTSAFQACRRRVVSKWRTCSHRPCSDTATARRALERMMPLTTLDHAHIPCLSLHSWLGGVLSRLSKSNCGGGAGEGRAGGGGAGEGGAVGVAGHVSWCRWQRDTP